MLGVVSDIIMKVFGTTIWVVICAGKWWGSSDEQPVVALHGLFDNAASFDFICPHLDVPAVLALDLPGHGRSSHFPKGTSWSYTTMVMSLRHLMKNHFKWPHVRLMGHSYGSSLALTYAGLYPKQVEALISIDCARAANATDDADLAVTLRKNVERTLTIEAKPSAKPRSFEECVTTMSKRRFVLTQQQTEALAQRSLSNVGCGNYIFNEDLRMSVPSLGRNTHLGFDFLASHVRCSVLNIIATDGILIGEAMAIMKKHSELMRKNCPSVDDKIISGGHHIHMDSPVEVAAAINKFWNGLDLSTMQDSVPSASKWWGDRSTRPILALHGLLDNCATFDPLLPFVDAESVLAIDLPGHGMSSHIGPGLCDNFPNVVSCIRYLVKHHFQWPTVDFLGHSFGSCVSFVYSGLYPKTVGKYISLDCARFNMAKGTASPAMLQLATDRALMTAEPPVRSYDEQLSEFIESRQAYPLSEGASKVLLSRSLRETGPGKYVETADPRLPVYLGYLPISTLDQLAINITCEVLSVQFSGGVFKKAIKEANDRHIAVMKNTSPNLVSVVIDGGHHAHLENPETVAPTINSFLRGE